MNKVDNPFNEGTIVIGKEKAERYTSSLRSELRGAKTEEDVRLATFNFLKGLTKEMGVNVKIQNEKVVLTGGRIDSLFDNIIFEFKKPAYFDTPAGIGEAVNGRKNEGGLMEYVISVACAESNSIEDFKRHLSTKIGVGFDGKSFIFVRYVSNVNNEVDLKRYKQKLKAKAPAWFPNFLDGNFEATGKRDIKNGLRFIFLYLRSISPRAPLTPSNVSFRFGEQSPHFKKHLKVIYSLLCKKLQDNDPHTKTLYGEWDRVFGKVYGDINSATSDVRQEISDKYKEDNGFPGQKEVDLKLLIFSIHTYYNIILKLR